IAHPKPELFGVDVTKSPVIQELLKKRSGYLHAVNSLNVEMYSSFRYIDDLKWGVVAQVPVETTQQAVKEFHRYLWKISIAAFIVVSIIAAFHALSTIKPLRRLYEAVDQVAKGNFKSTFVSIAGKDEISILSARFNEMIESLNFTRNELLNK